ncbi:hypothetical protein Q9233_009315 [Columba guinea]|nr:hypothetical protein Q9233_009315 [Columba guinea]
MAHRQLLISGGKGLSVSVEFALNLLRAMVPPPLLSLSGGLSNPWLLKDASSLALYLSFSVLGVSTGCDSDHWGPHCSNRCQCQNEALCNPITGACVCADGYRGWRCEELCDPGSYGKGCQFQCQCHNGATCDHRTGECHCAPGYTGVLCQEECPIGTYGFQCTQRCDCQNGAKCYHVNGACLCDPGFKGIYCQERMCPEGFYGLKCNKRCPCNITNTLSCHPLSGECSCKAGWSGLYCNESCPPGSYGEGCQLTCPCHNGADCDSVTGKCSCAPGYMTQKNLTKLEFATFVLTEHCSTSSSVLLCCNVGFFGCVEHVGAQMLEDREALYTCVRGIQAEGLHKFFSVDREMTAPLPAWQEPTEPIAHQFVIAKMMVRVLLWMVCAIAKKGGKEWIALFHVPVEVGVLTVTRRVIAQMEQHADRPMAFVSAHLGGKGTSVTSHVLNIVRELCWSRVVGISMCDCISELTGSGVLGWLQIRSIFYIQIQELICSGYCPCEVTIPVKIEVTLFNDLLFICPSGKYGKDCAEVCQCTENGTCNPMDGSCQCFPGWIGTDCSQTALMMEELNPYTKISPALGSERHSVGAIIGIIILLLIIMVLLALFVWYRRKQKEKGHDMPSVSYTPAMRMTNTDYSLSGPLMDYTVTQFTTLAIDLHMVNDRYLATSTHPTHVLEVKTLKLLSSRLSDGQTVTLLYSSKYLIDLKGKVAKCELSNKILDRETADWRPYTYLNELDYMKESVCSSSTCSLNSSENPYATIKDPPILTCKHSESSYVEMKSPGHRESPYSEMPTSSTANKNIYEVEPTVSVVQDARSRSASYLQNPYDLPRNSHIPSHYDLLPIKLPACVQLLVLQAIGLVTKGLPPKQNPQDCSEICTVEDTWQQFPHCEDTWQPPEQA